MNDLLVAWYRRLRAWGWDPRFALRVAHERAARGEVVPQK